MRNSNTVAAPPGLSGRMRHVLAALGAIIIAAILGGCVVVPTRPVAYHPVVVRPYAYVVY